MRLAAAYGPYLRVRSFLSVRGLAARIRVRAIASRARVRVHALGPVTRLRGLRVQIRRRARANVFLGEDLSVEPGCVLVLGTGTLSIGERTAIGPRTVIDVDDGGVVVVGDHVRIGQGGVVRARGTDVQLRPEAVIEDYVVISATDEGSVAVDRGATVGPRAVLASGARVDAGAAVPAHAVLGSGPAGSGERPRAPDRPGAAGVDVSVVVTTRDRAGALPGLFDALARQTLGTDRFEVVVVDDGSADDTPRVLRELSADAPFRAQVVRRGSSGGPAVGRNVGWRRARGPVIAFTDDDCHPAPEWLEEGLAEVRAGADFVQGRTLPDPRQAAGAGVFVLTNRATREAGLYESCNMFYRHEVLDRVGGFDERFPYPMAEDTDLGWRSREAGFRSAFATGALLYHDVRRIGVRGWIRRGRRFGSHALLVRKHPAARRLYFLGIFLRRSHPYLLLAVGSGVAAAFTTPWLLAGLAPYIAHRLSDWTLPLGMGRRLAALPGFVAVDAVEMATLAVASIRYRTVLL